LIDQTTTSLSSGDLLQTLLAKNMVKFLKSLIGRYNMQEFEDVARNERHLKTSREMLEALNAKCLAILAETGIDKNERHRVEDILKVIN
jgi:hypothetical protein